MDEDNICIAGMDHRRAPAIPQEVCRDVISMDEDNVCIAGMDHRTDPAIRVQ